MLRATTAASAVSKWRNKNGRVLTSSFLLLSPERSGLLSSSSFGLSRWFCAAAAGVGGGDRGVLLDYCHHLHRRNVRLLWSSPSFQHRFKSTRASGGGSAAVASTAAETDDDDSSESDVEDTVVDEEEEEDASSSASASASGASWYNNVCPREVSRLRHIRNIGIFAHVDAGKTTVTERMLVLAGVVDRAGNVDDGNTVTDYLPAERERGITIQSAAITFPWAFHNADAGESDSNDSVSITLIDTPGHVDFSVEVNRSVAVLDGAVLVVDAAAGVQAQTQTVWRAMTRPSLINNHELWSEEHRHPEDSLWRKQQDHAHEPLPCLAVINKMDKVGADFFKAVQSLRHKLPGANPIPIQLPLFRSSLRGVASDSSSSSSSGGGVVGNELLQGLLVGTDSASSSSEQFAGIVDLIHMRAVVWPQHIADESIVENCIPTVIPLWDQDQPIHTNCSITRAAMAGRNELIEAMAELDGHIEALYLEEINATNAELRQAIRRATLRQKALPVMAAAAVQGKGIEPCLDAIADFLPSPLDRMPPALTQLQENSNNNSATNRTPTTSSPVPVPTKTKHKRNNAAPSLGHCFHPSLLALAFKVLHMKGRGGSGEGRVVFCRVYSGSLQARDMVQVITPPKLGESTATVRTERIGGMLEMAGGRFDAMGPDDQANAGHVCALIGLKTVVTGDTLILKTNNSSPSSKKKNKKSKPSKKQQRQQQQQHEPPMAAYCAGVSAPKPVLTVKLEAESVTEHARLIHALTLLSIEDPSLVVEEKDSYTLLSGLGELHIEIALDRLKREHGIQVMVGNPSVSYRETIIEQLETNGLVLFDRMIGETHFQASIALKLEPLLKEIEDPEVSCHVLSDPTVTLSNEVLTYLGYGGYDGGDSTARMMTPQQLEELEVQSELVRTLVQGCKGALKRGPKGYPMANCICHIQKIDAGPEGLPSILSKPGALRGAAVQAIQSLLGHSQHQNNDKNVNSSCVVLEPKMSLELSLPNEMVGSVLSDLTTRRGTVEHVFLGDSSSSSSKNNNNRMERKALVRGEVPLLEILGYATTLRSLTGGEGTFTSEYKGHAPCPK